VLVVLLAVTCAGAARAAGDDLAQVRSLVSQKKYDDAFGRVRQYLSAHPGDAEARLLQGIIESRQGRTRQATETFRKLVVDHPDLPEPLNTLAVLYAAQGRFEEARAALERAVTVDPGYAVAQENLGDVYVKLAENSYQRVASLEKGNVRAKRLATALSRLVEGKETPAMQSRAPEAAASPQPEAAVPAPSVAATVPAAQPATTAAPTRTSPAGSPEPTPAPAVHTATPAHCYVVGGLGAQDEARHIESWFNGRAARARTLPSGGKVLHLVYVPPLSSRAAARSQLERMRQQGIRDVALIMKGEHANGISLGAYSVEANADRRIEELKGLGYKAAKEAMPRSPTKWSVDAAVTGDPATLEQAFSQAFPQRELKPVECGKDG